MRSVGCFVGGAIRNMVQSFYMERLHYIDEHSTSVGATPYVVVPDQNAAERQIERHEYGSSLEEIYAEQVRATETIGG